MFEIHGRSFFSVDPVYDEDEGEEEEGDVLFQFSDVILTGFQVTPYGDYAPPDDFLINVVDDEGFHYFATYCCGDELGCHYELVETIETGGSSEPPEEIF